MKPLVYTDKSSLDELSSVLSSGAFLDHPEKQKYYQRIYYLLEQSIIHIELDEIDKKNYIETNRMLKTIRTKSAGAFIYNSEISLSNLQKTSPEIIAHSIVILLNKNEVAEVLEELGILVLCLDQPQNINYLFNKNVFKKANEELQDCLEENLPNVSNSMMIIDNHSLENKNFINSFVALFSKLTPDQLNIPYHLTFFVFPSDNYKIERRIKELKDKLLVIKPNVTFVINAYSVRKYEFHDREIVTNYHYAISGEGVAPEKSRATYINFQFLTLDHLGIQPYTIATDLLIRLSRKVDDLIRNPMMGVTPVAFGDYETKNRLFKYLS